MKIEDVGKLAIGMKVKTKLKVGRITDITVFINLEGESRNYFPEDIELCLCQYCQTDISEYLGGQSTECANCWEVRKRFKSFIDSENNINFLVTELRKLGFLITR